MDKKNTMTFDEYMANCQKTLETFRKEARKIVPRAKYTGTRAYFFYIQPAEEALIAAYKAQCIKVEFYKDDNYVELDAWQKMGKTFNRARKAYLRKTDQEEFI